MQKNIKPESASYSLANWIGFLFLTSLLFLLFQYQSVLDMSQQILVLLVFPPILILLIENLYYKNWKKNDLSCKGMSASFFLFKYTGALITFFLLGIIYWTLPEYQFFKKPFYTPVFNIIKNYWFIFFMIATLYFWGMSFLDREKDGYYQIGRWVWTKEPIDKEILQQFALGWLVKGFFLPLMVSYMAIYLKNMPTYWEMLKQGLHHNKLNFISFYNFLFELIFLIDVTMASYGYLFSLKLTGTQIKSVDTTFKGWVVALVCYQPFFSLIESSYIQYNNHVYWHNAFNSEVLTICLGVLILICVSIYLWATLSFGVRFSNLTNRGIITNGPYAWIKHPAYLAKCCSWFFISLPILVDISNPFQCIQHTLMFTCLCYIYYMRAKTEEIHLMKDPLYQQYISSLRKV